MGTQNVLGVDYSYPNVADDPWGTTHIAWASAVSSATNTLQTSISTISDVTIPALQAQINISGQSNTTSNQGGGQGLALAKSGVDLPFKTLVAGTNISLTSASNTLTINATGTGDVNGPAGAIDTNVPVFNGTTGKLIKMSGVKIDASDNITIPGNVTISGTGTQSVTAAFGNQCIDKTTRAVGTSVGIRGVATSNASATITETTTTPQDIGVTATIITSGRPVHIFCTSTSLGYFSIYQTTTSGNACQGTIGIYRDGVLKSSQNFGLSYATSSTAEVRVPPGSIQYMDTPASGTYVYTVRISRVFANSTVECSNIRIVTYEL